MSQGLSILGLNGRLAQIDVSGVEVLPPQPKAVDNENIANTDIPAWHKSAVILHANGATLMEVSKSLAKSPRVVSDILSTDWAKTEMLKITSEFSVGAAEERQLKSCAMEAVMVLQQLMHTAQSEAVKLNAAKEVLDRTLGKTAQRIHHTGQQSALDPREEIEKLKAELKITTNNN